MKTFKVGDRVKYTQAWAKQWPEHNMTDVGTIVEVGESHRLNKNSTQHIDISLHLVNWSSRVESMKVFACNIKELN